MTNTKHPSVVVLSGAEAGTVFEIDQVLNDFSVGSDPGCHLVLAGASISPIHASLFLDDEGVVTLADTKSRTGVFVGGKKTFEQPLSDGDEIFIGPPGDPGGAHLRFRVKESPLVSDAPALSEVDDFFPEAALPEAALPDAAIEDATPPPVEEFSDLEMPSEPDLTSRQTGSGLLEGGGEDLSLLPSLEDAGLAAESVPALEESEPEPPPRPAPPSVPKPSQAKTAPGRVPAKPAAPARPGRPPAKRLAEDADDPLAGLGESLGASDGERVEPPPPVPEAAPAVSVPKKAGASALVMVVRLAVIGVALAGLASYGLGKYSESIAVPVVDSFLPNPAEPGQTVTINGSGFGAEPDPSAVKVFLGDVPARVLDVNPTRINLEIPESLGDPGSQMLKLRVEAGGASSAARLLRISVVPKIASFTPRVALAGEEVALAGRWLSNPKTRPIVRVAGNEAEILEATAAQIRFKIPTMSATEGEKLMVKVAVGSELSKEAFLYYGRLPFVESVSPDRALPGEVLTVTGIGLLEPDASVVVGGRAAAILSATDTEMRISAPGLRLTESAGRRDLRVQAKEKTSALHPVEILRESASLFSPRFFVELLDGPRVAVSCELGPVMVLGGDAPSRKRAHDAAARLNALARAGRNTRVQFSISDTVINAQGGPVLAVGAGDGGGNPRSLAPVWAAQLTDMFDLYLQGRRPTQTVELSPAGKVFLDIFAAARRRSAEAGVSQSLLYAPDPAWVRSLATLAAAPTLGSGQAPALLDGFWVGVIEVPGTIQPRRVEISLTATPPDLVGQRTSRQGRLATDVTLRNLSYARRELRFSFVDSGETLEYVGRLDGDTIEGNVSKAQGGRVGKLTFRLTR